MPNIMLNLLDSYHLMATVEEVVHTPSFFKDRYFPTGAEDIFSADKVLVEYRDGDEEMAPFVSQRVRDIPVDRGGYAMHELQPAYIGLSRLLTADQLTQRGFGEAIYPNSTPAERAARLLLQDFSDLDKRIRRREEWMAVQTMLNNGLDMQEYIDKETKGPVNHIRFYDTHSDHKYTPSKRWSSAENKFFADVRAMAEALTTRGLPATDLVLGSDVADAILENAKVRELLDRNSGIIVGTVNPTIDASGVTHMGTLNFGGHHLNVISVSETYRDDETGLTKYFFPTTSAMVTAPACGRTMYGQITQMDYGSTEFTTYAKERVPKLIVDQDHDERKLRLGCRPITVPRNYCPYIVADNLVD